MIAWARRWHEAGEMDKARHLAQRLREFRNPQADEFFAVCDDAATAAARRRPSSAGRRPRVPRLARLPALKRRARRHGAATQSPDLPPRFRAARTSPMTMPRSTALHMS